MKFSRSSSVIEGILRKRDLLKRGDPRAKEIRVCLLILGGANLGAYGAGAGIALHELRLVNVFDWVVGMSTGAWVGAFLLAGPKQIRQGAAIYYQDFSGSQLFSYWPPKRFMMSKQRIASSTLIGDKMLDADAVLESAAKFFVGLTTEDGRGIFIDAKTAKPNILAALYASSANPLAYEKPLLVNKARYWDGGIALQCPVWEICQQFHPRPTHILVLPNTPYLPKRTRVRAIVERVFGEIALHHMPPHIRQLI